MRLRVRERMRVRVCVSVCAHIQTQESLAGDEMTRERSWGWTGRGCWPSEAYRVPARTSSSGARLRDGRRGAGPPRVVQESWQVAIFGWAAPDMYIIHHLLLLRARFLDADSTRVNTCVGHHQEIALALVFPPRTCTAKCTMKMRKNWVHTVNISAAFMDKTPWIKR